LNQDLAEDEQIDFVEHRLTVNLVSITCAYWVVTGVVLPSCRNLYNEALWQTHIV